MSRKIIDIYKEYKIFPMLQMHMLRVAGVASIICDNLDITVNKNDIISACLLHDMGNIIKADLVYFPEAIEPQGLEYWSEVKMSFIKKYGSSELEANLLIIQELGFDNLVSIVSAFGYPKAVKNLQDDNFSKKICFCADLRVAPLGVVSTRERIEEGRKRYEKRSDFDLSQLEREEIENAVFGIEKQIFAHCKIKPEDITEESVAPIIEELKNFVI